MINPSLPVMFNGGAISSNLRKALEDPDNFYLNWAPGPMGTRMFEYMKNCILTDPTSTKEEIDMWKSMKPLECSYSGMDLTFNSCVSFARDSWSYSQNVTPYPIKPKNFWDCLNRERTERNTMANMLIFMIWSKFAQTLVLIFWNV